MNLRKILHQLHEIKSEVCLNSFDKYNALSKTYILSIKGQLESARQSFKECQTQCNTLLFDNNNVRV